MAIGDSLYGLGIGLQSRPPLYENIGMAGIQQKQQMKKATDEADRKKLDDLYKEINIDYSKYHSKVTPIVRDNVAKFVNDVIELRKQDPTTYYNTVQSQLLPNLKKTLNDFQNMSTLINNYQTMGAKGDVLVNDELMKAFNTNPGDLSDVAEIISKNPMLGFTFDMEKNIFGGAPVANIDVVKQFSDMLSANKQKAVEFFDSRSGQRVFKLKDTDMDAMLVEMLKDPIFNKNFAYKYGDPNDARIRMNFIKQNEGAGMLGVTPPSRGGGYGSSVNIKFGEQQDGVTTGINVGYTTPTGETLNTLLAKPNDDYFSFQNVYTGTTDLSIPSNVIFGVNDVYKFGKTSSGGNFVENNFSGEKGITKVQDPVIEPYSTANRDINITTGSGENITIKKGTIIDANYLDRIDKNSISPALYLVGNQVDEGGEFVQQVIIPVGKVENNLKNYLLNKKNEKGFNTNAYRDFEKLLKAYESSHSQLYGKSNNIVNTSTTTNTNTKGSSSGSFFE